MSIMRWDNNHEQEVALGLYSRLPSTLQGSIVVVDDLLKIIPYLTKIIAYGFLQITRTQNAVTSITSLL